MKLKEIAPIVLFVYNRADLTKRTLTSLKKNALSEESTLYIYADGIRENASPDERKKVEEVKRVIKEEKWCKEVIIIESETNNGLANSIIKGVTDVVNKYGKVIVLEDDLLTSPYFLTFMNESLQIYEEYTEVGAISGFIYPSTQKYPDLFLATLPECLGWATWKRAWDVFEKDIYKCLSYFDSEEKVRKFEYNHSFGGYNFLLAQKDKKVNSWYIRWAASLFQHNMLTLYTGTNLISHIGYESGTHKYPAFMKPEIISENPSKAKLIPVEISEEGEKMIEAFYNGQKKMWKEHYKHPFKLDKSVWKRWIGFMIPHGLYLYLKGEI